MNNCNAINCRQTQPLIRIQRPKMRALLPHYNIKSSLQILLFPFIWCLCGHKKHTVDYKYSNETNIFKSINPTIAFWIISQVYSKAHQAKSMDNLEAHFNPFMYQRQRRLIEKPVQGIYLQRFTFSSLCKPVYMYLLYNL